MHIAGLNERPLTPEETATLDPNNPDDGVRHIAMSPARLAMASGVGLSVLATSPDQYPLWGLFPHKDSLSPLRPLTQTTLAIVAMTTRLSGLADRRWAVDQKQFSPDPATFKRFAHDGLVPLGDSTLETVKGAVSAFREITANDILGGRDIHIGVLAMGETMPVLAALDLDQGTYTPYPLPEPRKNSLFSGIVNGRPVLRA